MSDQPVSQLDLPAPGDWPVRPRLLGPILVRGDDEVQIGSTPERALLLRRCSPQLVAAMRRLDGSHTLTEAALHCGAEPAELNLVLRQLLRAGIVATSEAPANRSPAAMTIRLLGARSLGRTFAEKFIAAGVAALSLVDPERPQEGLYDHPETTGAESLRTHLRLTNRVPRSRLRVGGHWSQPDSEPAALTVVALEQIECDRAITDTLLRTDQPHLFLRPGEGAVVVGPLVVPGLTACTRCMDLLRCSDPRWPQVLSQLCRTRCEVSAPLVDWGAATALQQVLAFLAGGQPDSLGTTVELDEASWLPTVRTWPSHPACGCQFLQ